MKNHHAKYPSRRSFYSTVSLSRGHTDAHSGPTALPGPQTGQ